MAGRTLVILVVALVVVAAAAALLILSQPKPKPSPTPTTSTTPTHTASTTPAGAPTTASPRTSTTSPTTTTAPARVCKEEITLTILTRHPTEILEKTRQLFLGSEIAKKYCIKDLKFIQLPPGWWVQYIKKQAVDVAWGGGPTLFDQLLAAKVLRPLDSPLVLKAMKQIPDTIAGAPTKRVVNGKVYWVAAAIASFGFTVNTEVAKKIGYDWTKLKTWKDLASDELGLLLVKLGTPVAGIADPTMSTSNTRMFEIMLQAYGWEKGWGILTILGANSRIYQGSGDVRDAVINGELMVGITIDFYGYTAQKLNPACKYILPKGETIVNGDPIAVTISSKHPEAAQAFVAWVLTEGQKVWLDPHINRMPVNPNVFKTPEGAKRQDLYKAYMETLKTKSMNFNDTLAMLTEDAMRLYFKATIVDLHQLLQKAWTRLLKAYYVEHKISKEAFEKLKRKLMELPVFKDPVTGKPTKFTIEYAKYASKLLREKPQIADKLMNAWREAARAKYLEVLRELGG